MSLFSGYLITFYDFGSVLYAYYMWSAIVGLVCGGAILDLGQRNV